MNISHLRPLAKTEAPAMANTKPPALDRQIVSLVVIAVVIFYFTAVGIWDVFGPLIHRGINLNN